MTNLDTRFFYVDTIDRLQKTGENQYQITGTKRFAEREALRSVQENGEATIPVAALAEAVGQLCSWPILNATNFSFRPLYGRVEKITALEKVRPGSIVRYDGYVKVAGQMAIFNSQAYLGRKIVLEVKNLYAPLYPLSELEDPRFLDQDQSSKQRFQRLTRGSPSDEQSCSEHPYQRLQVSGEEISADKKSMTGSFSVPSTSWFYRDHFPTKPMTPMCILGDTILGAAQRLMGGNDQDQLLDLKSVSNLQISDFVSPDESVEYRVTRTSDSQVSAELSKQGRVILKGDYELGR